MGLVPSQEEEEEREDKEAAEWVGEVGCHWLLFSFLPLDYNEPDPLSGTEPDHF